jgi:hypothetical protein
MMQTEELAKQLPTRGRQIKFTPERLQQIRNLVERGKSREEPSLDSGCRSISSARPHSISNHTGAPPRAPRREDHPALTPTLAAVKILPPALRSHRRPSSQLGCPALGTLERPRGPRLRRKNSCEFRAAVIALLLARCLHCRNIQTTSTGRLPRVQP